MELDSGMNQRLVEAATIVWRYGRDALDQESPRPWLLESRPPLAWLNEGGVMWHFWKVITMNLDCVNASE